MACTAAFAIAEGTTYGEPVQTQVVSVDRTLPGSPSAIQRLPAARVVWYEPFITVPVTASNARGLRCWVWAMKFAAALLDAVSSVGRVSARWIPSWRRPQRWTSGTVVDELTGDAAPETRTPSGDEDPLPLQQSSGERGWWGAQSSVLVPWAG